MKTRLQNIANLLQLVELTEQFLLDVFKTSAADIRNLAALSKITDNIARLAAIRKTLALLHEGIINPTSPTPPTNPHDLIEQATDDLNQILTDASLAMPTSTSADPSTISTPEGESDSSFSELRVPNSVLQSTPSSNSSFSPSSMESIPSILSVNFPIPKFQIPTSLNFSAPSAPSAVKNSILPEIPNPKSAINAHSSVPPCLRGEKALHSSPLHPLRPLRPLSLQSLRPLSIRALRRIPFDRLAPYIIATARRALKLSEPPRLKPFWHDLFPDKATRDFMRSFWPKPGATIDQLLKKCSRQTKSIGTSLNKLEKDLNTFIPPPVSNTS